MSETPANTSAYNEDAAQLARLRQFLNWFLGVILFVSLSMFLLFLTQHISLMAYTSGLAIGVALIVILARFMLQRGAVMRAVMLISSTFLIAAVFIVVFLPIVPVGLPLFALLSIMVALPYLRRRYLAMLSFGVWIIAVAVTAFRYANVIPPLLPDPPDWLIGGINVGSVAVMMGLTLLLIWQYSARLNATLERVCASNADLRETQALLETRVAERTAALQRVLHEVQIHAADQERLLEENIRQRDAIRELSVPVLPVTNQTLVMPLVGALDSQRLLMIREQALHAIEQDRARCLVIDITGVPLVDSQIAQGLLEVVQAAQLLGAQVALVGIRPEVAQTVVGLGLELPGMRTYSDLRSAMEQLDRKPKPTTA